MSVLTDKPSVVAKRFAEISKKSGIKKATDDFYKYCQKIYYIKTDRVAKNITWKADTDFGKLDTMTINLSKPEKDPKEIALQGIATRQRKCVSQVFALCGKPGLCGPLKPPRKTKFKINTA